MSEKRAERAKPAAKQSHDLVRPPAIETLLSAVDRIRETERRAAK